MIINFKKIIYLRERERETNREGEWQEKEGDLPLVRTPAGRNIWGWTRLKTGVKSFFSIPLGVAATQALRASSAVFPWKLDQKCRLKLVPR